MKSYFSLAAVILLSNLLVQPALAMTYGDSDPEPLVRLTSPTTSMDRNLYSFGLSAGSGLNNSEDALASPTLSVEALWALPHSYFTVGLSADMLSIATNNIQGEPVTLMSQGLMLVLGYWTNRDRDRGVFEKWGLGKLGWHAYAGSGVAYGGANSEAFALSSAFNFRVKAGLGADWKFKSGKDDADLVLEINDTVTNVSLVPASGRFTPVNSAYLNNLAVQLGVRVWH